MKPKFSTGYLTPQANRRRVSTPSHSETRDEFHLLNNANESFFANLMNCPIKRQLILNLISSEKENITEHKRKQAEEPKINQLNGSPMSKVQKKHQCESPTALFRRRALEQQARQSPLSETQSDDRSRPDSRQSRSSSSPSPIPFDKLLDGVIAYVEIKSKEAQDRSSGAKALMRSMGAIVKDNFTKDVTHVIFKDGSFATYQKAKLMKVHLVSVLWIEAVRTSYVRVPEKRFPALGTEDYDHNVSSLCSQMQKEYEEIIREQVNLSLATGTPLPSTKSLIDRRRTIMTPLPSTSNQRSFESPSTQDREVEKIITLGGKNCNFESSVHAPITASPELTSDDDSDLGPCINGSIINKKKKYVEDDVVLNSLENLPDLSSMELTDMHNSASLVNEGKKRNAMKIIERNTEIGTLNGQKYVASNRAGSRNSFYNKQTPKLPSKSAHAQKSPQKSEDGFNLPDNSLYRRKTQLVISLNISSGNLEKGKANTESISSNNASEVSDLKILSKNSCSIMAHNVENQGDNISTSLSSLRLSPGRNIPLEKSSSTMSALQISSGSSELKQGVKSVNNIDKSTSTNMSSLQISSEIKEVRSNKVKLTSDNSTSTNMSALVISAESSKGQVNASNENEKVNNGSPEKTSMTKAQEKSFCSIGDSSFSPLNNKTVQNVLTILGNAPLPEENVTKRRRGRPRKSVLPSSNNEGDAKSKTDESTPQNQLESVDTVNKDVDINTDRRMTLRGKVESATKKDLLPVKVRKTLGTRRRTILPYHPATEHVTADNLPDTGSPPKKAKSGSRSSLELPSDSKVSTNKETTYQTRKMRAVNKIAQSSSENSSQGNKSTSDESDISGSEKKRRMRKLYNPDDSVNEGTVSDEQEREQKRTQVTKRRPNGGIIVNPAIISVASNILLTAKAKEYVEKNNIDVQAILEKESASEDDKTPIPKRGRKKKNEKRISVNSDADEQKELAEQFLKKKDVASVKSSVKKPTSKSVGKVVKRRQSVRLSQHPRKNLKFDSSTSSSSSDEKTVSPKISNRRSTMEFQKLSQKTAKKNLKIDKSKQPSIVCTRMHKDDIQVFTQIVRKLGGFVIEDEVSDKTTHLVAGQPKRTVNMLRAIARGCWVMKHEWLLKSLEEGKWLPEEDYEETDFSSAVQECRLQRQAFGPSFSMDILKGCGPIYIARGSIPRCSDLRDLVNLCQGKVVTIPRNASIVVGEYVRHEGVICVTEIWLLDSISLNKKMPFKKYIIKSGTKSPHV